MKCMNCGNILPDDQMICPVCGREVQIVPDYNPLDDVLAAEVKGAVNQTIARHTDQKETGQFSREEREMRRRRAEKKKLIARKKRQRAMIIIGAAAVLLLIVGMLLYQDSYTGYVKKGYRLLAAQEYDEALVIFKKAATKNVKRSEAYTGLSEVYIAQEDLEKAERIFLNAVSEQSSNVELYRAAIQFYIETDQESKVSILLAGCSDDKVLAELESFVSEVPKFSLNEKEIYDDIQVLELESSGKAIYYTTDGTDPTTSSKKYTNPIKLEEGETEVRAISVNKKGISSLVVSKTYIIEYPIEAAPSVTPSTGQYESDQMIEVIVPDNYEAYYTLDGSVPDPEHNSETVHYTEPVPMPEGNTIFSVVLVDQRGRHSDITKRNYELIYSE